MGRVLERIAARVAEGHEYQAEWKNRVLYRILGKSSSRFRITGLWVAGSYARGAMECGDLDIVMNLKIEEGSVPDERVITRTVFGHAPDVRLYSGSPEENSSGVAFSESRLIWSPERPDWRAGISEILPDLASAGHYARPTDALPLRAEQLRVDEPQELDELIELKNSGILDWLWVPMDEIRVRPRSWSKQSQEFLKHIRRMSRHGFYRQKTLAMLPFAVQYVEQAGGGWARWDQAPSNKTSFRIGGTEIVIGRPSVQPHGLDRLSCSRLILIPRRSRRGPNGLWILSRGVNHPLEQACRACRLWYAQNPGRPDVVRCQDSGRAWLQLDGLDVFRTKRSAERWLAEQQREWTSAGAGEVDMRIVEISGSELLSLISNVDVVFMGQQSFDVTYQGAVFNGAEPGHAAHNAMAKAEDLLALCRNRGRKRRIDNC